MVTYIEYLGLPATVGLAIVAVFLVIQIIGELLEFKGKAVPEIMKIRKYFARKKAEKETIRSFPDVVKGIKETVAAMNAKFDDFTGHYSTDNIHKRDEWIAGVNQHFIDHDENIRLMQEQIATNSENTLNLLIDHQRKAIIDFASYVVDEKHPVTREQFNRIFKVHADYEKIIKQNGLTNGEVKIAYRIISEAYEKHMENHTFIEDIRGYES